MSIRTATPKKAALPDNPIYLDFLRSDGDESLRPEKTECIVDSVGHVNWMEACALDDGRTIRWRRGVALGVATKMKMPGARQLNDTAAFPFVCFMR